MPCKNGTRDEHERSKQQYERDRLYRQSEEYHYWAQLVERVNQQHWSLLPQHDQHYFVISILMGEVFNGGFDQYFFNSSGDYYKKTKQVLIQYGEEEILRILLRAKQLIFAERDVPVCYEQRRHVLQSIEAQKTQRYDAELLRLEDLFLEKSESLTGLLLKLALKYQLYKPFE
ncbi:DMP19 family protein [Acinetobacter tianfuensis]|uniref:DUF4375 domain-containing protein n=1 Tax=Acinetobacter tianfuensis TaxID=2419603 RepID=A0A3A8ED32_9GAMM|nr:DUF4375 domain-containing protein [Acinetobacter tianfuensis]RKG32129.1 DUF4375 domain-containing protein [Acinetobacter tianfuensis]